VPSSIASSAIRWIRAKEWDERLAGNMKIDDTRQRTGVQSNPGHPQTSPFALDVLELA